METKFIGKKTGLLIVITRYGADDYSAWWTDENHVDDETFGRSVRGTMLQIMQEIKEEV